MPTSPSIPDGVRLAGHGLGCRRSGRPVLAGISFALGPGQALELHGANGSGKTSLLRLLAGLAAPAEGELHWKGRPLRPGDADYARCRAYLGHHNAMSADLSPLENLRFAQRLEGSRADTPVAGALEAWGLGPVAHRPTGRLSQGQRRRLALARVWLGRQPLWLLDEPTAALDAAGEALFDTRLAAHLAAGGAAIVATHRPLALPAASRQVLHLDGGAC